MLHVVTYDVSNDDVRTNVARVLARYGERVQESVFECRFGASDVEEVKMRLGLMLAELPDSSVRFYRLCGACAGAAVGVGIVRRAASSDGFIVS